VDVAPQVTKRLVGAAVALCGVLAALVVGAQVLRPRPPASAEDFRPVRYLIPVEPTTDVPVQPVGEAQDALTPDELVLGVTVNGASRAYPLDMLGAEPGRKALNDTLGGSAIVATWCDACRTAVVYGRALDGRTLTFGVSGELWKGGMVLYDQETWSRWSQPLGEAMAGPLKGKRLQPLPAVLTDWQRWCATQPDSTVVVLPIRSREHRRDALRGPERLVLGIAAGDRAKAWDLEDLAADPARNDDWAGRAVLAVLDRPSFTARLFERTVGPRVLTFRADGDGLTDLETGSTWEPVSGRAVAGPLAGECLAPLPAAVMERGAWLRFHPPAP
jgi:hypothetical protein